MTVKQFAERLQQKAKDMALFADPLRIGALTATAEMGTRIFDKGQRQDGAQMKSPGYSSYSTKPIYVNPDKLKEMKVPGNIGATEGKPKPGKSRGESVFKSGKKKGQKHKTKYLAGGYKELRNKLGRRTDVVDLSLSGELRLDFSNGNPSAPRPEKVNDLEYVIRIDRQNNQDKVGGANDRFGTVFSPSGKEREDFIRVVQFEFNKRLNA